MYRRLCTLAIQLGLLPLLGSVHGGCGPKAARVTAAGSLDKYVAAAKAQPESQRSDGSLWVSHGRRSDLFRDFKARDLNDVVTIRVSEATRAVTSADAANSRKSSANLGIPNLFGVENKVKELPNAVNAKSDSQYEGQGSTSRNTSITTTITARVTDVLANGYLVVEGVKEVRLNNENQTVYLRGVVRPEDITPGNIVSSADVGQMELRVEGRGLVSQPLNPGWLYKILMGISPF
jgi:flagellar L-ring protein precursor FlgH